MSSKCWRMSSSRASHDEVTVLPEPPIPKNPTLQRRCNCQRWQSNCQEIARCDAQHCRSFNASPALVVGREQHHLQRVHLGTLSEAPRQDRHLWRELCKVPFIGCVLSTQDVLAHVLELGLHRIHIAVGVPNAVRCRLMASLVRDAGAERAEVGLELRVGWRGVKRRPKQSCRQNRSTSEWFSPLHKGAS